MNFQHKSVLLDETINALVTRPEGIYVDCTLGGAGHASQTVSRLTSAGWFIGIDQDPDALAASRQKLAGADCRVDIINNNFQYLDKILNDLEITEIDGIMFDLGVSSYQLDTAERGFSYMQDGPLDMRMSPESELSAADVVNTYSEEELFRVIKEYGEERWAKRIAQFIVSDRKITPITRTGQLVNIIKKAIPSGARKNGPHPAKRTFQAIRIEVNSELTILKATFTAAVNRLKSGGRICIITFHSLEDRIAKHTLQGLAKGCICPPHLPICVCGHKPSIKIIGKPIVPSAEELENNPRARSAKLRVAQKI